jgi:hypothetical protein
MNGLTDEPVIDLSGLLSGCSNRRSMHFGEQLVMWLVLYQFFRAARSCEREKLSGRTIRLIGAVFSSFIPNLTFSPSFSQAIVQACL